MCGAMGCTLGGGCDFTEKVVDRKSVWHKVARKDLIPTFFFQPKSLTQVS